MNLIDRLIGLTYLPLLVFHVLGWLFCWLVMRRRRVPCRHEENLAELEALTTKVLYGDHQ